MGMTTRHTSAANLQKAFNQNLVTIKQVKVELKELDHESKTITADQFKNDLDYYMKSGIFADTLDFKYALQYKTLLVDIGYMSCYCDKCINVNLSVNDGVNIDDLEKVLRKVEED